MNMENERVGVTERRNYSVKNTEEAKEIVLSYIKDASFFGNNISYGLPEVNDRYHVWKVPIKYCGVDVGDIIVNAYTREIDTALSSDFSVIEGRINSVKAGKSTQRPKRSSGKKFTVSTLNNIIIRGRSEVALKTLPEQSVDMIFTSPPYYNARKQYSEYETYEDYLLQMRQIIQECKRVLIDGKFFIMNSSHVLEPRASRNESSSRIAVPFDLHQIFMEEGFEFVDDIIWQKPEGAGWASGRGRRFSADRNPMQYKAVPVTEYVMVYRKKPCLLIDHFIRDNPDQSIVQESKIGDDYEKTNIWYICPAHDKRHPAIFPIELAEKVIRYYSFKNDVVLDPFGGIGTTAKAAINLERRFCYIEMSDKYVEDTITDIDALANNLLRPFDYEYVDLSNAAPVEPLVSFDGLVRKLIEQGYSKAELYKLLKHATAK